MKVWTLHLSHRHGDRVHVYASEEAAEAALDAWVDEWWDHEIARGRPEVTRPDDPSERCSLYFDIVEDENYAIEEHDLDLGPVREALSLALPLLQQEAEDAENSGHAEEWQPYRTAANAVAAALALAEGQDNA